MHEHAGLAATVKLIADSLNPDGERISTLQLMYPRIIHAEFMTHRDFSRNASSSRAIPVERMLAQIEANPAMPVHWGKNQPGMQAYEEVDEQAKAEAKKLWIQGARDAVALSRRLQALGLHKQIANRVTEPYQFIKVVMTSTTFANWFALRDHEAADPTIQDLAKCMDHVLMESKPRHLRWGEWHLPYEKSSDIVTIEQQIKICTARCARVSYDRHDGESDAMDVDFKLHDRLVKATPPHMSPAEHPAVAIRGQFANFNGFASYRWQLEREVCIGRGWQ